MLLTGVNFINNNKYAVNKQNNFKAQSVNLKPAQDTVSFSGQGWSFVRQEAGATINTTIRKGEIITEKIFNDGKIVKKKIDTETENLLEENIKRKDGIQIKNEYYPKTGKLSIKDVIFPDKSSGILKYDENSGKLVAKTIIKPNNNLFQQCWDPVTGKMISMYKIVSGVKAERSIYNGKTGKMKEYECKFPNGTAYHLNFNEEENLIKSVIFNEDGSIDNIDHENNILTRLDAYGRTLYSGRLEQDKT